MKFITLKARTRGHPRSSFQVASRLRRTTPRSQSRRSSEHRVCKSDAKKKAANAFIARVTVSREKRAFVARLE